MTRFLKTGLAAAMLASAFTATPVLASQDGEPAEAYVRYDDLDLSTERGLGLLESRYRDAAQYACGMDIRETGTRMARREARLCYAEKLRNYEREVAAIIAADRRNV
ncbi:MAG: UrcA family protein [Erythrobacter sp.]|nr:MAG: UrcA family protein [Erythrobacter sp.]